jgi:hypothetical protein
MLYTENPYYSPEKWGLKTVAECEFSDMDYQFDLRVVWQDEKGRLYTARDSGCSCPAPFEDYREIGQLERVTQKVLKSLEAEVREGLRYSYGGNPGLRREGPAFLGLVYKAMQEARLPAEES